jgi:uncharacterized protein YbaR (Trm112 family)
MLSQEFLDILICPKCKGDLEYRTSGDGKSDVLICHACKLVYPVEDDIPNFIIEEARPLEDLV